ncbi:MAG TPA: c-type cytochrome [Gaiellaceae bacterium]|nr:c-type cytochrome [Gaiellaceae bacterium]
MTLVAVLAAGCGTQGVGSAGNTSQGKELFNSPEARCGACHTLADAGARGTVGPNLDEAFAGPRKEGFKESSIRAIVLDQIHYPTKGSGMPADLVTGEDAEAVAAYVASVAGKEVEGGPPPGTGEGLFASLGCQGCHSLSGAKGTGPPLNGIFGKQSKLTNGQSVPVTQAYLIESIRDPDAKIVAGYQPGVMSAVIRKNQVSQADAKKLADFIKSKK